MQIHIKTSEANKQVVKSLTNKLNLGPENVIARIALTYSLAQQDKFSLEDMKDSKGKEYKEDVLLGNYKNLYMALISQHYGLYRTDKDIVKYIKIHIDHGLELLNKLFESSKNYSGLDFLFENIEKGIEALYGLDSQLGFVSNNNQKIIKNYFKEKIELNVGSNIDNESPIYLFPNNTNNYNNCHIAIAGATGTGKTQFALEILRQISVNTKNQVNFIYLDFKGLKEDDLKYYEPFFKETKAVLINAPHKRFPVNPLSFIDIVNEKNRLMGINKFVDIISKYSNIGKNQYLILKDATKSAFDHAKDGSYPSLTDIYNAYLDVVGDKPSTLREILESLSELEVFESDVDNAKSFLNDNFYLSLSGDLPVSVRFTSVFLIINYIYNIFMNMPNTTVEDNIVGIRYILVIDEAHVLFKEKKYQDILEKILREIRSKGVSVMLLSQGIEEFNQPSFDFSTMCEIAFLLNIKDKAKSKIIGKFLGLGEKDFTKIARSMENIETGQAISNIKEFDNAKLFKINQYRYNK